jgi:hypothetical protein
MSALLRHMDESEGRAKLASRGGGPSIPHFHNIGFPLKPRDQIPAVGLAVATLRGL